jgi:hypothetical protein
MVSAPRRAAGKINGRYAVIFRGTDQTDWFVAIRRYLVVTTVGHLVWETAQLPLYTLWRTGMPAQIGAAVVHCTIGDMAIAIVVLVVALALFGAPAWPDEKFRSVFMAALAGGIGYTIYSEYVNTGPRASWTYSEWMPTLPWIGTGLSPLAQWTLVPSLAFRLARRCVCSPPRVGGRWL